MSSRAEMRPSAERRECVSAFTYDFSESAIWELLEIEVDPRFEQHVFRDLTEGGEMYSVQVSAHILNYPHCCCCCCGSGANTSFPATATRVWGERVVRTDSKSFNFPLCNACKAWMNRQHAANAARDWFIMSASFAIGYPIGLFGVAAAMGGFHLFPWRAVLLLVAASILLAAVVVLACRNWRRRQRAANSCKPAVDCVVEPVIYCGWHGSVRDFRFACGDYCERFRAANAGRVLDRWRQA